MFFFDNFGFYELFLNGIDVLLFFFCIFAS